MTTRLSLTEYVSQQFDRQQLSDAVGELLWQTYRSQVAVEFPSPKTGGRWELTAQGWVGHIPLSPDLTLTLQPKVELGNLFRMLEYAYNLESFRLLEGSIESDTLADLFERLANILALRVLKRGRQGFQRAYLARQETLSTMRGRLDLNRALQTPGQVGLPCHFEEHTADLEDNQILAWTLFGLARSPICSERVQPTVRRAYRALQGLVTLTPFSAEVCANRLYHRLNQDYQPLHALCRLFLEQIGPSHDSGERSMLPFLVDMARLYEKFVAAWLQAHLPAGWGLKVQERVSLGEGQRLHLDLDLVLVDLETGQAAIVLDTKYKTPDKPAHADIYQVVAYAEAIGCREAILVYPTPLPEPVDTIWGHNIRVRTLTFGLAADLEQAGQAFLAGLM